MFEQEINLCSKPLGLESFLLQQQNSAEPGTVIPFGDAGGRLRAPVAEEAWLAELPHCRVDALNHLLVQDGVWGEGESPQSPGPQAQVALGAPRLSSWSSLSYTLWALLPSPSRTVSALEPDLANQHTDAGPGSGKDDSLCGCSRSPPNREYPLSLPPRDRPSASAHRTP